MKTLLYCYRRGRFNNFLGLIRARIAPRYYFSSPPMDSEHFPYYLLEEVDLAYIVLHGLDGATGVVFGDGYVPALETVRLKGLDLSGLTVFMEGCNGLDTGFAEAFLNAGAARVIGSHETTFDYKIKQSEDGKVGTEVVRRLKAGKPYDDVLAGSKFKEVTLDTGPIVAV